MAAAGKRRRERRVLALTHLALVVVSIIFLFPIFWVIFSSFKTLQQVYLVPPLIFFQPTLDAYARLFRNVAFYRGFLNSLTVAGVSVALSLLLGVTGAYALARFKNALTANVGVWVIMTRLAPPFALVLPFYLMMRALHLYDTVFALFIMYITINLPFTIWLLKGYFEELPVELEESAQVEGCSRLQALWHVLLPMSMPMLIAVCVLNFLFSWNEFLFAFLITAKEARTLPVMIPALSGTIVLDWPLMTAMSTIMIIPSLLFVSFVQKHIVKGLTFGALK